MALAEADFAESELKQRRFADLTCGARSWDRARRVIARLVSDPSAISRIARKALEVCHYRSISGEWRNAEDLENHEDDCEAGCYRCLLSYYNQPDHPQIDRQNAEMHDLLCRLIHGASKRLELQATKRDSFRELANASSSPLEKAWLDFIRARGHRLPDKAQPYLDAYGTTPDFAYSDSQTLIYIDGPHHQKPGQRADDAAIGRRLADAGFTVVRFATDKKAWPDIVSKYAWVFGPGAR